MFAPHLHLAHEYWKKQLKRGDMVIDATCGNGHDTLFLAQEVLTPCSGTVYALDIQKIALETTREKIKEQFSSISSQVIFYHQCHATFPKEITPNSVSLIVYNLGYLPGSSKEIKTLKDTTSKSFLNALPLIKSNGMISVTFYPGHEGGEQEQEALLEIVSGLDPKIWSCCFHSWVNRKRAPNLLIIKKFSGNSLE